MVIIKSIKDGNIYSFRKDDLIAYPTVGETVEISNEKFSVRGTVCAVTHQIEKMDNTKHSIIIFIY